MRLNWLIGVVVVIAFATPALGKTYRVYYLGGQSNMDGFGRVSELPAELNQPVEGVMIFHGSTVGDGQPVDGRGAWDVLKPGHGAGFSANGTRNQVGDRFGPELTFARRMKELHPNDGIAIIKYSRGGTSIDQKAEWATQAGCWEPDFNEGEGAGKGINQYDHCLATIRNAMSDRDIDDDGTDDQLIPSGIVWMQGESDAGDVEIAGRYEANLKRLMDLLRAALRADDLPIAIGRISDSRKDAPKADRIWKEGEIVRAAQAAFCDKDQTAKLVTSTDGYGYSDPYHYDSAGYLDLGVEFANAIHALETRAD